MSGPPVEARRRATLLPVLALLYASMCGGPYGTEDFVAKIGPGALLLLLVVTPWIWGIPLALAASELSAGHSVGGGYYRWALSYLGPFWGFQAGIWSLIVSFLDSALYPVLFSRGFARAFPGLTPLHEWLIAVAFIVVFTYVNHRGIRLAGRAAIALNAFLMLPLAWLIGAAALQASQNPFQPFLAPGINVTSTWGVCLALAMWLYSGYYEVSTVSEEIERPERNIPLGLLIVTPLVVMSYALPTLAGLAVTTNWSTWSSGEFTSIGRQLGGRALAGWLFLGNAASQSVVFLTYMLWYSRLAWAMSQEGHLPAFFTRLSPRHGTPSRVLWLYAAIYSVMALLPFEDLLVADSWLTAALAIVVQASLVRSRGVERSKSGFRIPGGSAGLWLNAGLPAATGLALVVLTWDEHWLLSAGSLIAGPILYYLTLPFRRPPATT